MATRFLSLLISIRRRMGVEGNLPVSGVLPKLASLPKPEDDRVRRVGAALGEDVPSIADVKSVPPGE